MLKGNPMAWSYSSINLFKQCPRKYYRLKVTKDVKEPFAEHLIYGNAVHKAAELYGRDDVELPEKYAYVKPYLDTLLQIEGEKLFEHKMGITAALEPCAFNDKNVWWRGIADFMVISENKPLATIIDYKTGKSAKYADTQQLEILSLATFLHYPQVETVKAALLFVVSQEFVEVKIQAKDARTLWKKWFSDVDAMDTCQHTNVWNPKQNFTCRNHCPVMDCEHNGRS